MPDLTTEIAYICCTNVHWSKTVVGSKGGQYTVTFGFQPTGPVQYDWSCTCKGYKFRHGCRHIEDSKGERCGWNNELDPGLQPDFVNGEARCPKCGGPITLVQVAV